MARPIRVEFAGAVYHVMARGNERRSIFRDDQDRRLFLETLGEMVQQFGVVVHAYCLMTNHYHLVVETPLGNLSRAIGWLQVTYTVRFNRRHRRSGHLFQGRFKAQVVEAAEHAQWLVPYVHLNPVRPRQKGAMIPVERRAELERYQWSSHRDYAGLRQKPEWLSLAWLRYWGRTEAEARRAYRGDIRRAFDRVVERRWDSLRGGLVLGGDALWQKVKARLERKSGLEESRWIDQQAGREVRERVRAVLEGEQDRRLRIWIRVRLGGERMVDVSRELGYRDGGSVLQVVKRLEQAAQNDPGLRQRMGELRQKLGLSSVES
jgi:putative transposase